MRYPSLFLFFLMACFTVSANHIAGRKISIEATNDSLKYVVKLVIYRDCQGLNLPNFQSVVFKDIISGYTDSLQVFLISDSVIQQTNYNCQVSMPANCAGAKGAIEQYIYSDTLQLPFTNGCWMVNHREPNWIGGMLDAYITAFINTNITGNSTPEFIFPFKYQFCSGMVNYLNNSIDIDADSIVYSFEPVMQMLYPPMQISYNPPLNYQNFISSVTPVTLNTNSGNVSFYPNQVNIAYYEIRASEFRNGDLVSWSTHNQLVMASSGPVGIEEQVETGSMSVYPNPASNEAYLNINIEYPVPGNISVYDITGKLIIKQEGMIENNGLRIDTSMLPAGMYFIRMDTEKASYMETLIRK